MIGRHKEMNTQLKQANARIAKAMSVRNAKQAKATNAKPANDKLVQTKANSTSHKPSTSATKPAAPQPNGKNGKHDMPVAVPQAKVIEQPAPVKEPPSEPMTALHFEVRAGVLATALQHVERASAKRSTLPILSTLLVEANPNEETVTIIATDLTIALSKTIEARVYTPGRVCIPTILTDAVSRLDPQTPVTIQTQAKTWLTTLRAGKVTGHIKATSADEFPTITPFNGKHSESFTVLLTPTEINELAKRVIPSVATDDARPSLNGSYLQATLPNESGNSVTANLVSADGYRMSVWQHDILTAFREKPRHSEIGLIIPPRVFTEALKLVTDEAKPIPFTFHIQYNSKGEWERGMVRVEFSDRWLQMMLLDGNYPDYRQIVKDTADAKLIPLPVSDTLDAVGSASLFASSQIIRLACDVENKEVIIRSQDVDTGDFEERISVPFDSAAPATDFEIAFNARYLSDAIKAVSYNDGDAPARLYVNTNASPGFFKSRNYVHVVMPMHIGRDGKEEKPAPNVKPQPDAPTPEQDCSDTQHPANDKASKAVIAQVEAAHAKQKADAPKDAQSQLYKNGKTKAAPAKSKAAPAKTK